MTTVTYRSEMRRCGKSTCQRCLSGPAHGPYWYAYSRDARGHLRSRYLGKALPTAATPFTAAPPLRAILCGDFVVHCAGEPLHWPRRTAQHLLALLLLHPNGLPRTAICAALWPDSPPTTARTALHTATSILRRLLEPTRLARLPSTRLPAATAVLRLHLVPADWVDTHRLLSVTPDMPIADLLEAAGLYTGPLLPHWGDAEWVMPAQTAIHHHWQSVMLALARRLDALGQTAEALAILTRLLVDDPACAAAAALTTAVLAHSEQSIAFPPSGMLRHTTTAITLLHAHTESTDATHPATHHQAIPYRDVPDGCAAVLETAHSAYRQGHLHTAHHAARLACALADQSGNRQLRIAARQRLAEIVGALGRINQAIAIVQSALALTKGDGSLHLHLTVTLAHSFWRAGRFAESTTLYRHCAEQAPRWKAVDLEIWATCGWGGSLFSLGDGDAAERVLGRMANKARDTYQHLAATYHLAGVWAERAALEQMAGDSPARARTQAEMFFQQAIDCAQRDHNTPMVVFSASEAAAAAAQWGSMEDARHMLEIAEHTLPLCPDDPAVYGCLLLSASEVALAEQNPRQALALLAKARPTLGQCSPAGLAPLYRLAGRAHRLLGNQAAERQAWEHSLSAARRSGQRGEFLRTRQSMR